jgi:5,10-methylene-tetrahydrofolate dehydrogenase/methenyl tetrahydrofolate cyclohydrolase
MSEELSKVRIRNPDFMPRLDIIKANDRPDTAVYIRQKLNALREVYSCEFTDTF